MDTIFFCKPARVVSPKPDSPEATAAAREAGASSFVDKLDFSANAAASLDRLLGLARPVAKAA